MHSRFIPVGVSPLGAHIVFDWLPGQAGTVSHFRHFMLGLESRKRARESKRERARGENERESEERGGKNEKKRADSKRRQEMRKGRETERGE